MGLFDSIFNDVSSAANWAGNQINKGINSFEEGVGDVLQPTIGKAAAAASPATVKALGDVAEYGAIGGGILLATTATGGALAPADVALASGSDAGADAAAASTSADAAPASTAADAAPASTSADTSAATASTSADTSAATDTATAATSPATSVGEGETVPTEAAPAQEITPDMTPQQMAEAQYSAGATPAGQAQTITSNMTPQQMAQAQSALNPGLSPLQIASKVAKGVGVGVSVGSKIVEKNNADQLAKLYAQAAKETALKLPPPTMIMPQPVQLSSPQDNPIYNAIFGNEMPTAGISSLTTSNKKKVVKHDS